MENKDVNFVEVGYGQEAYVLKGDLREIEGLGGSVFSRNPLTVAKRVNWNRSGEYWDGHDLFCKHLSLCLLDEFFLREGRYTQSHIPVPLGSFDGGYYYEFVRGDEGFPLGILDENYNQVVVEIKEWIPFVNSFNSFGFGVESDVADPMDAMSAKNVILREWDINSLYETGQLGPYWKRIDFGSFSCPFNYEKFKNEIGTRKNDLTNCLGDENYRLALSSAEFFVNERIQDQKMEDFYELVLKFRKERT
jgi:hypothetical protein